MLNIRNPVIKYYVLPYAILILVPIFALAFLSQFTDGALNFLWKSFSQEETTLILFVPAVVLVLLYLRYTVMYLPDLTKNTPNKNTGRVRPSRLEVWFSAAPILMCGLMLGLGFKQDGIMSEAIEIANLNEANKLTNHSYFYFHGESHLVSYENFFYGLKTTHYKGATRENITTHFGGLVSSKKRISDSIYLYRNDKYLYGDKRDKAKELKAAEFAERAEFRRYRRFLSNGGYFKRQEIQFQLLSRSGVNLKLNNLYFCCQHHYVILEEPSSMKWVSIVSFIVCYLLAMLLPLAKRNDKIDTTKYSVFQKLPTVWGKLFGFKYNVGGIRRKFTKEQQKIYLAPKTKKKPKPIMYCNGCGGKLKWKYVQNEERETTKAWYCSNSKCEECEQRR